MCRNRKEAGGCGVTTSFDIPSLGGKTLTGIWNRRRYVVERKLGEGANGWVFLVRSGMNRYALKIGMDAIDIQSEANVLRKVSATEGPFHSWLVDVDDIRLGGMLRSFYVMKYVPGVHIRSFVRKKGEAWLPVAGLRLLQRLNALHRMGLVFGDLKQENVLVSGFAEVGLVDFGGVTPMGQAVKQFTELYDRWFWNAGSRTADEGYDLFAFAILVLQLLEEAHQAPFLSAHVGPDQRNARSIHRLRDTLLAHPAGRVYAPFLWKALTGSFADSAQAIREWMGLFDGRYPDAGRSRDPLGPLVPVLLKTGFALSLFLFAFVVCYYR